MSIWQNPNGTWGGGGLQSGPGIHPMGAASAPASSALDWANSVMSSWKPPAQPASPATTTPPPTPSFQPFGNSPMVPNVQTSITPTGVYNDAQTQAAVNQARAKIAADNDPLQLMHQSDTPGVSRSSGSMAAIIPQLSQARADSSTAQYQIPFNDTKANLASLLAGQQAQGNEWLNLAGTANQMNQNVIGNNYNNVNFLLQLLSGLGFTGA